MKKIIIVSLCFVGFLFYCFYKPAKAPAKIAVVQAEASGWDAHPTEEQVASMKALLSEPLFYLGKGKQALAFQTKDGNFVVKVLLQKPLRLKARFEKLPDYFPFSLIKEQKRGERLARKEALYSSFLLAYTTLPEETGTLFVHIDATKNLFSKTLIVDRDGNPCKTDLDNAQFVVQKKAMLLKPLLAELMWNGKVDEAKKRIDQVFRLLFDCAKKGVCDLDQALIRNNNIGFTEDRAILIDIGKLRLKPEMKEKKAFVKDLTRLRALHSWLALYYPELSDYFMEQKAIVIEAF